MPDIQVKQLPSSDQLTFLEVSVAEIVSLFIQTPIYLYKVENRCVFERKGPTGGVIYGKFIVYPFKMESNNLIIVDPVKLTLEDTRKTIIQKLLSASLNIELYPHSRAKLACLDGGDLGLPEDW